MVTYLLSKPILAQLSTFLSSHLGWHFPPDRWRDLERGICAVAHDLGFTDIQACIESLQTLPLTQQYIETLADHFTIGETYFFREHRALEILTTHILPPLIHARQNAERRLRIWSAACCTGEEPYSIAMMLHTMRTMLSGWNISVLGTDINPRFLQKAEVGLYGEWSFRSTPMSMKERYFQRTEGNRYLILPQIKQFVTFLPLNLADEFFPSPLNNAAVVDVIFCRNVFIYFSPERAQTIIRNLHHVLEPGGWLIVSPSEISYLADSPFEAVHFPGAILHCKPDSSCPPTQRNKSRTFSTLTPLPVATSACPALTSHLDNEVHQTTSFSAPLEEPLHHNSVLASPVASATTPQPLVGPESDYAQAATLYQQGRYGEAKEALLSLLARNRSIPTPNGEEAMCLLIRSCANQGALASALTWCRKAVADNSVSHRLYYLLATLLLELGDDEGAIRSLKRTLLLKNDFILAHFTLGNLARRQKKEQEAQKHFRNALSLLSHYQQEDLIPESEGLTAGRLSAVLRTMLVR